MSCTGVLLKGYQLPADWHSPPTIRVRDAGRSRGSSVGRFMQNIKALLLLLIVLPPGF